MLNPFVRASLIAIVAAGCGGAGGVRRMMLSHGTDGGADAIEPPFMCAGSIEPLNCASPFRPTGDGHIVDFSNREWNSSSGKWCDATGMHGSIFSFKGNGANDSSGASVAADGSLRLMLGVSTGSYGGGGLAFEAGCVDASAFQGVQFTIAVASGSLSGCAYQIQLQTFEQRPTTQSPSGGCDQNFTSCYGFPYVRDNLPAASTDPTLPTLVSLPFSRFSASMLPAPAQIVGLQWQVNSTSGMCTVELRIDDVGFIPMAASDDGGATTDASPAASSASD